MLKLDLGSGPNPREGFIGVDTIKFPKVDIVMDLRDKWIWEDDSVDEVHSSHTIEHLETWDRVHFYNELYRVMKKDAKATIWAPHWGSCRATGDPSHAWPPISEFSFYYLSKSWRDGNAPHVDIEHNPKGYSCNFQVVWAYTLNPQLMTKNTEYQQFAMAWYKEAIYDIQATLTK